MSNIRLTAVLILAMLAVPFAAQAQEPAGRILWMFGQVERVGPDGVAKALAKGDPVFQGDVIRSAPGSHAQLVMSDEALIAVRPDSSLRLEAYTYQGREDGTERALVELLKGGLRSVTGAIGRTNKDNYQLRNGMHLVGIRGTDHETFATERGTYDRVTLGGTYVQSPDGRVDLAPGETGFVDLATGSRPLRLERTPEFMHVVALTSANTGPQFRERAPADDQRLQKSALPSTFSLRASPGMPASAPALSDDAGKGGRCGGPCVDPLNNPGKGGGKGAGKDHGNGRR